MVCLGWGKSITHQRFLSNGPENKSASYHTYSVFISLKWVWTNQVNKVKASPEQKLKSVNFILLLAWLLA